MGPDGNYTPVPRPEGATPVNAQAQLMSLALQDARAAVSPPAPQEKKAGFFHRLLGKKSD